MAKSRTELVTNDAPSRVSNIFFDLYYWLHGLFFDND